MTSPNLHISHSTKTMKRLIQPPRNTEKKHLQHSSGALRRLHHGGPREELPSIHQLCKGQPCQRQQRACKIHLGSDRMIHLSMSNNSLIETHRCCDIFLWEHHMGDGGYVKCMTNQLYPSWMCLKMVDLPLMCGHSRGEKW